MKTGSQVEITNKGIGTIVRMDGNYSFVDIDGQEYKVITKFLKAPKAKKVKSYMKDESVVSEGWVNVVSVKNLIMGDLKSRGSNFDFTGEWTKLMKMADEKGHFAGTIIMNAIDGKYVSEKQAWAVAYFAKSVGLTK